MNNQTIPTGDNRCSERLRETHLTLPLAQCQREAGHEGQHWFRGRSQ